MKRGSVFKRTSKEKLKCSYPAFFLLCVIFFILSSGNRVKAQTPDSINIPEKKSKQIRRIPFINEYNFKNAELDTSGLSVFRGYIKTAEFYDRLHKISQRSLITRELHNIIIVPPGEGQTSDTLSTKKSVSPFIYDEGKIIRKIYVDQIDVFGPSMSDTSVSGLSWWQEAGNTMHVNTNEQIIRKNLLFEAGEKIDAYQLSDNERLIRELPYIEDARIFTVNTCGICDSADILIRTKDVWSVGLDGQLDAVGEGRVDIFDRNILGIGHEFRNSLYWNSKEDALLGYQGEFQMRNIGGSFINATANYAQIFRNRSYGIEMNRVFITDQIKFAGGVDLQRFEGLQAVRYLDTVLIASPVERKAADVWLGRMFTLDNNDKFINGRANLVLAVGYHGRRFELRPRVNEDLNYSFHNRSLLIGSVSFVKQNFYKSNLIYSFGRTEDIPYGNRYTMLFGHELNEFYNRYYLGFSFLKGNYLNERGYLQSEISLGGFVHQETIQQGVFRFRLNYFSNLYIIKSLKFRQFIRYTYVEGINRLQNEFVGLNAASEIIGLTSPSFFGNRKMVTNLESVIFSPYQYLGFRFAFFVGADFGFLSKRNVSLLESEPFTAISLGVRVRNERLVFKTFQLRFSFYPVAPNDATGRYIDVIGEERLNPVDFFVEEPMPIEFR